jgi:hypothetical protein
MLINVVGRDSSEEPGDVFEHPLRDDHDRVQ